MLNTYAQAISTSSLFQWGTFYHTQNQTLDVTLSMSYSNTLYAVCCCSMRQGNGDETYCVNYTAVNVFKVYTYALAHHARYMSIGY